MAAPGSCWSRAHGARSRPWPLGSGASPDSGSEDLVPGRGDDIREAALAIGSGNADRDQPNGIAWRIGGDLDRGAPDGLAVRVRQASVELQACPWRRRPRNEPHHRAFSPRPRPVGRPTLRRVAKRREGRSWHGRRSPAGRSSSRFRRGRVRGAELVDARSGSVRRPRSSPGADPLGRWPGMPDVASALADLDLHRCRGQNGGRDVPLRGGISRGPAARRPVGSLLVEPQVNRVRRAQCVGTGCPPRPRARPEGLLARLACSQPFERLNPRRRAQPAEQPWGPQSRYHARVIGAYAWGGFSQPTVKRFVRRQAYRPARGCTRPGGSLSTRAR